MNWLVYIAAVFVFISYALIPKSPLRGWIAGVIGNGLYTIAFLQYHRIELMIAPVGFTALSIWNVCRELHKSSRP
jgi:hypothetical protein